MTMARATVWWSRTLLVLHPIAMISTRTAVIGCPSKEMLGLPDIHPNSALTWSPIPVHSSLILHMRHLQ